MYKLLYILILLDSFDTHSAKVSSRLIFNEEKVKQNIQFKQKLKNLQKGGLLLTSANLLQRASQENLELHTMSLFKEFVDLFERQYKDDVDEFNKRYAVFKESTERHTALNTKEKMNNGTATYGINKFADWTHEEFLTILGGQKTVSKTEKISNVEAIHKLGSNSPCTYSPHYSSSSNWKKVLTRIKDQKNCGSCWAFVASEQVESYAAISGQPLVELSPQEFLSCSSEMGCEGGITCKALGWLASSPHKVLVTEKQYPYEDKDSNCNIDYRNNTGVSIKYVCGCRRLVNNEEIMLALLSEKGPLAVNVDAVLWRDYISGVIQHHCTYQNINHAIQIVGHNLKDGPVPYYIGRNQWGGSWGEDGFLRIKYGENVCGVAEQPSYVVM